jgi:hypothetical protein
MSKSNLFNFSTPFYDEGQNMPKWLRDQDFLKLNVPLLEEYNKKTDITFNVHQASEHESHIWGYKIPFPPFSGRMKRHESLGTLGGMIAGGSIYAYTFPMDGVVPGLGFMTAWIGGAILGCNVTSKESSDGKAFVDGLSVGAIHGRTSGYSIQNNNEKNEN